MTRSEIDLSVGDCYPLEYVQNFFTGFFFFMKKLVLSSWVDVLILSPIILSLVFLPGAHFPFGIGKVLFFEVVVAVALMARLFLSEKETWHRPNIQWGIPLACVAFVGALTLSSLFGIDPINSFFGNTYRILSVVFFLFLVIWLFLLIPVVQDPKRREITLNVWMAISGFVGLYAFGELVGWVPKFGNAWERSSFTLGNPIMLTGALVVPLFVCVGLLLDSNVRRLRLWYGVAILIMLLGMYAAGSRGGLLGLVAGGLGMLGYVLLRKTVFNKRAMLLSVGAIVLLLGIFLGVRYASPQTSIGYRLTHFEGQNVTDRLAYWRVAVEGWKQHPVFGVGYQNFYQVTNALYKNSATERENIWADKVHNQVVEWLVTGGIITFGAYIALLLTALFISFKRLPVVVGSALFGAIVAHEVTNAFAFYSPTSLVHLVLALALIVVLSEASPQKRDWHIPLSLKRSISLATLLVFLGYFGWIAFPSAHQLVRRLSAINLAETDPVVAAAMLEKNRADWFVFDPVVDQRIFLTIVKTLVQQQDHSPEALQIAQSSIETGKLAIALHPLHARAWSELGRNYLLAAELTDTAVDPAAYQVAQRVADLAPHRDEADLLMAGLFVQDGDIDRAIESTKHALELSTERSQVLFQLGQYYGYKGEIEQGAQFVLQAAQTSNRSLGKIEQYMWAVNYFAEQKAYQSVLTLYKQAYEADATQIQILPNLAATYAAVGRFQEAIDTATLLKQQDPNSAKQVDSFIKQVLQQ